LPRRGRAAAPGVLVHRATGCRDGAATLLYEVRGGGHRLPGHDGWPLMALLGPTTLDADASELMLGFARDPRAAPGLPGQAATRLARP
ncbi:hypothetical protein, partial [Falsiroseomonas oryzae]|uniref:hypothetical protein n=1 Tax=Falsiroseomonas oryzae TaxID=2766473 RepID=UPI0022EAFCBC